MAQGPREASKPEQPAPPRHNFTQPADPEAEPNPGDPGPPIMTPRTPDDPEEKLRGVPRKDA